MLIFQPVEVEGKQLYGFFDWEPQSKTYDGLFMYQQRC